MLDRSYYHSLRGLYKPDKLKLIVVAESPPTSGKYFYDNTGVPTEPLFGAFMQRLGIAASPRKRACASFNKEVGFWWTRRTNQ
jgi:hypothetical protein